MGAIEETITVRPQAPLVETANATLGVVIDEQKVVDLPLNGRNFTQLGTLIPGVVAPPAGLGGQTGDATPGGFGNSTGGFNVNGMRNQSNNFLMDGATNNDTFNTGFVLRPPPDAIQEFKILTHAFGAEYGRNAGSVVERGHQVRQQHVARALWEFNRDDALQARNYFAPADQPKPEAEAEPVRRRARRPARAQQAVRLRLLRGLPQRRRHHRRRRRALGGPARAATSPRCRVHPRPADRPAVPGQHHPGQPPRSGRAMKLLDDFVPLPNSAGNRYTCRRPWTTTATSSGMRFDYRINEQHSLLGRYMRSDTERATPAHRAAVDQKALATLQDFMGAHNYVISSNDDQPGALLVNRITREPGR